ncbi:MAG TPA: serine/threonine-protein kinase, partial [Myxococcaceae bacterium]|nr:serine/threonine-protein kinase [Myxococcaceae bacterium]
METPEQARVRTEWLIGRTLGEFVVREKVGEGGFGAVFRAEQPLLAREAVIKVLHSKGRISESAVQRFLREARLASSLDHPYAAHIYAFGAEPDGLLWIAMELVRGSTLDKLLKVQGPLPLARFVPLFDRICEVVHTAHEQGIIHRDLKPANVMVLSRAGRLLPKLLDLGVAKLREDSNEDGHGPAADAPDGANGGQRSGTQTSPDRASLEEVSGQLARAAVTQITERGLFIGSPHYMAPEQWVNAASADQRTDLYALGVLCYEALTGRRPFDGATVLDIARGHAHKPLPPLGPDFPDGLLAVLERATAKNLGDRFATALEFSAAFRAASGLAEEPEQLPQLEETVRETVIASAPQPLAEAVSALEAARTVAQSLEAVAQAFRIVARWLGLLALACRARIGPGGARDSAMVLEHLAILRRQSLTDEQWVNAASADQRTDLYALGVLCYEAL